MATRYKIISAKDVDTDSSMASNSDVKIPSQKAVKTYADNHGSPTGSILPFAGSSAPTGFLIADGASLLRADYAALFAVIGTAYGGVDGTHFTLPDLKGKVIVGVNASETEFDVLGETGGAKTHTLSIAELPSHYHTVDPPATNSGNVSSDHSHGITIPRTNDTNWSSTSQGFLIHGDDGTTANVVNRQTGGISANHYHATDIAQFNSGSTGTGTAHNNLQPYLVVNYIIKT
jgi:microcystin-dependent protein